MASSLSRTRTGVVTAMLLLDTTPGAPPGVWTDQRLGIAGAVMVGTLLVRLYEGLARAEIEADEAIIVRGRPDEATGSPSEKADDLPG